MTDVRSNNTPAAAITGAGAGLGRQIALGLAEQGYRVFGTALSAQEIEDLPQASDGSVRLTIVDVTDDQAVHSWAEQTTGELGDHGLDVLISNAGILTPGPLEVLPLQAIRHEFEVNVFGSLAVINAFLPALRTGPGTDRPARLGDRQIPPPVQRPVQRIESGARGVRRRLPGRAQAVRRPLRDRGARQHGHGRAGGHRPRAAEASRIHDGRAARALRRHLRRVQHHVQQHAKQWTRRRHRSGTHHRGCPATACADPRTDRSGRRTTR